MKAYRVTAAVLLVVGSMSLAQDSSPQTAALKIDASKKSAFPIAKNLTGKFTEHLFFNVTNGIDAQILLNATMAEYPFKAGESPDGIALFQSDRKQIEQEIRRMGPRWGWPTDQLDGLAAAYNDALACWWTKVGNPATSPDTNPVGGRAQRIECSAAGQGIAQWCYLPMHRTRRYEFSIYARSRSAKTLIVELTQQGQDKPCAAAKVAGLSPEWKKLTGSVEIPAECNKDSAYRFAVTTESAGGVVIGRIELMPGDHVNGADPDVIAMLKQSRLPIHRWPGGNFVSGYRWKDGIGPVEQRPTKPNYAWGQVENNRFGTDEFVAFCRSIGCEPMICVNAGSGTPQEAAEWIQYCNGSADTPMGKLRVANGHLEPYRIRHWEIGNELWGRWQYHWTTAEGYVDRYKAFAEAMIKADPSITLYACGAPVFWGKDWNTTLIRGLGSAMQRTTDHPLIGGTVPPSTEPLDVYRDFMGVPAVLEQKWAALRDEMKTGGATDPHLAVTELQLFAHIGPGEKDAPRKLTGETLVAPATLAEGLYDTLIYHASVRLAPFVEMVTQSATVNHGGGLRKSRERVFANPCHYAQSMFAELAEATPVAIEIAAADQKAPMVLPELRNATPGCTYKAIDAVAAIDTKGQLLVSLVHRGTEGPIRLAISIDGVKADGQARITRLGGEKPWVVNTLENPTAVAPVDSTAAIVGGKLELDIPPFTQMLIRIPVMQ
jgi:alpha-N-arabinofuranosidase